jgi:hypothetical protein
MLPPVFDVTPFYGTTQGKVTRKVNKNKRHTFFYSYNTTLLICLYGYTLYRLLVTTVDGGPAYEGKEKKKTQGKTE